MKRLRIDKELKFTFKWMTDPEPANFGYFIKYVKMRYQENS